MKSKPKSFKMSLDLYVKAYLSYRKYRNFITDLESNWLGEDFKTVPKLLRELEIKRMKFYDKQFAIFKELIKLYRKELCKKLKISIDDINQNRIIYKHLIEYAKYKKININGIQTCEY